jgi:hypothetical protein
VPSKALAFPPARASLPALNGWILRVASTDRSHPIVF